MVGAGGEIRPRSARGGGDVKNYQGKKFKLSTGGGTDGAVVHFVEGTRPYIWFGTDGVCLGWIDGKRKAKALRRMCDDYLASRRLTPEPGDA